MNCLLLALPKHKLETFKQRLEPNKIQIFDFAVLELIKKNFEIDLKSFDYLVFGSSFAVEVFFEKFKQKVDLPILGIGPSIKQALEKYQQKLVLIPKIFNFENLGKELKTQNLIAQKRFLIVCAEKTLAFKLEQILKNNGGFSERLVVYAQTIPANLALDNLTNFLQTKNKSPNLNKLICLSSPEGVENFFYIVQKHNFQLNSQIKFLALGKSTQNKIKKYFKDFHVYLPSEYSYKGMQNFIEAFFCF